MILKQKMNRNITFSPKQIMTRKVKSNFRACRGDGPWSVETPILARAWGCCLQLLQANFPDHLQQQNKDEIIQYPIFGVHNEFDAHALVVAFLKMGERS
jgi:hypothetical protein